MKPPTSIFSACAHSGFFPTYRARLKKWEIIFKLNSTDHITEVIKLYAKWKQFLTPCNRGEGRLTRRIFHRAVSNKLDLRIK
ncbi:MAG: hypothetical protein DSO07_12570 [Thermoproteota archaeon]|uniref:Uncharacterized protein n=1 Tax=Candidatus Methanodesulfokora washburnensis TaxID=2478471 RepID=A0A3R9PJN3_9CREN|nr:hypothetical protein [Candidatus Methanodesulfokores washburnensis]RSN75295.1 hypothetical protein D6D85_06605 [Candidatus Methanodesulfokores washburnensis]TDA37500.1 MAG: hypothetical protein DSO07_12570 [Candidatus Korarchaeota archaeon]